MFRTKYRDGWRTKYKSISGTGGSAPSSPWLAGGVDPSSVVAIYRPSIAASLAASYLRVAGSGGNANLDPAVVGAGVAPTLASGAWVFNGSQFLDTGVTSMPITGSVVIKYNGAVGNLRFIYGSYVSGSSVFALRISDSNSMNPYNGSNAYFSPALLSGTYSICGKSVYRNSSLEGTISAGGTPPGPSIYIGALNGIGGLFCTANIQEFFVYSATLTGDQVAAIVAALA